MGQRECLKGNSLKHIELNGNKNTIYQNMRDIAKKSAEKKIYS